MVYIGQNHTHLITGYVVHVIAGGLSQGSTLHLYLHPPTAHFCFAHLRCMAVDPPPPHKYTHSLRTLQRKKAPGMDAGGKPTGVLWSRNAENVETIEGEIWTFQSPEVTKGFSPRECRSR